MSSYPYPSYLEQKYGQVVDVLGEGDFGEVIKVKNGYAIKIIIGETNYIDNLPSQSQIVDYSVSNNIISQYIMKNIEVYIDGAYTYLVMPLGNNIPFLPDKSQQLNIFTQMCLAISDCHRASIAHHDVKIENYIMTDQQVKLTDFGLAKIYPEVQSLDYRDGATFFYKAPEDLTQIINKNSYYASDVWGLGIILLKWQMNLTGRDLPFMANYTFNRVVMLAEIFDFLGTPTVDDYPEIVNLPLYSDALAKRKGYVNGLHKYVGDPVARDLLTKMLRLNPTNRITIFEVLQHSYFASSNLITNIYLSKPSLSQTLDARTLPKFNSLLDDNQYSIGANKIYQLYTTYGNNNYPIFSCGIALFNILSNYINFAEVDIGGVTSYAIAEMFYTSNPHPINNFTTNIELVGKYIDYFNQYLKYNLIVAHSYAYGIAYNIKIDTNKLTNILLDPKYRTHKFYYYK